MELSRRFFFPTTSRRPACFIRFAARAAGKRLGHIAKCREGAIRRLRGWRPRKSFTGERLERDSPALSFSNWN